MEMERSSHSEVDSGCEAVGLPPARRHELAQTGTTRFDECEGRSGDDQLFEALMYGATVEAAARVSGMSRRTAYRRLEAPEFRQRLEHARKRVRDNVVQRLVDASGAAIDRLWHLVENEDEFIQMRACALLLDSLAKVQRVMLQYGDVVQESCHMEQHEYGQSHLHVLTQEKTKTTRVG